MTATSDDARLVRTEDVAWDDLDKGSTTPEAMRKGVRRKWLLEGEGDFFVQYVEMPAGHVIAPHSHDHDELIVVLKGSATFPGLGSAGADDCLHLRADTPYSFEVGEDGIGFLIVRGAPATLEMR